MTIDEHDRGLAHDLGTLRALDRRHVLRLLLSASIAPVIGCSSKARDASDLGGDAGTDDGECAVIPSETEGPYPGDGSNGPNALSLSGIVRSDIRSSIGTLSGTAEGVPLTVELTLVATNDACQPLAGYALYLWHCDRDGDYSMYNNTEQNYLRGVQETDDDGVVSFTTVFPGCYSGRMPHIHFEIYPSLASTSAAGNKVKTSQLGFPDEICDDAYATTGYSASVTNYARISFATDNVFSDGTEHQIATVTGNVTDGYVARLTVGIAI